MNDDRIGVYPVKTTTNGFFEQPTLKDRVYNFLKTEILLGNLKPGQQLNILDLSNQMGISCAPVREALAMLCKDSLVVMEPRKQPSVAVRSPYDFRIAMELRVLLEPYAAELSIDKIPQEEIDRVRELVLAVKANPSDMNAFIDSDLAVHELLHTYANSKLLSDILVNVKNYSIHYRYLAEQKGSGQSMEDISGPILVSTEEHLAVLDCIERREPKALHDMMVRHLENAMLRNSIDD